MSQQFSATANVTEPIEDGRLVSPSVARNIIPLRQVLRNIAPREGRAIEIASGTGQHCVAFAASCPNLMWVPTDIDDERLASISIYVSEAQLPNLTLPVRLNATQPGWSQTTGPVDLIVLANLLHLISDAEAKIVLSEIAQALAPSGVFLLYGPFMREGALTSEGDKRFHESLISTDPEIGYKDEGAVIEWARDLGLDVSDIIEMPANNLSLVFRKPE